MAMDAAQPAPRIDRRSLGAWGEAVAARHLERLGMSVLDRNWRCREGEIDIVALDGRTVVFIEVRSRTDTAHGHPAETVGRMKQRQIGRAHV